MDKFYDLPQAEREVKDEIIAKVNGWFSQIVEKCSSKKIICTMEILFDRGYTIETIIDYAKNMGADLIVIGYSSVPSFGRWLKGDVAKGLLITPSLLVWFWLSKGSREAFIAAHLEQV